MRILKLFGIGSICIVMNTLILNGIVENISYKCNYCKDTYRGDFIYIIIFNVQKNCILKREQKGGWVFKEWVRYKIR